MKNLLYKEIKLTVHPVIYVLFGITALYNFLNIMTSTFSYILLIAAYSILFFGAKKGQQNNDLLYSALLPIRKKDIVKARIFIISIGAFIVFLITLIGALIFEKTGYILEDDTINGFGVGLDTFLICSGIGFVGLGISDLIYLPLYYRNGKSIILPTLLSVIFFELFAVLFTVVLPDKGIFDGLINSMTAQVIFFVISLAIYFGTRVLTYFISAKLLDKVDF